jgi:hypothetical protein
MYAVYRMESKYVIDSEENYCSIFSSKMHINADYEKELETYIFRIERSEILLDEKPPRKQMDRIMHEAGCCYYPLHLRVSPHLQILDVINLGEVWQRWQKYARETLEQMSSPELEHYFRFSEKNLASSRTFIAALYKNAFYNLYFRDIFMPTAGDKVCLIRWHNFPKREMNQSYLYQVKPVGENEIRLSGEIMKIVPEHNGVYDSTYGIGPEGEIRKITGKIETNPGDSYYIKQLSIVSEKMITRKQDAKSLIIDD